METSIKGFRDRCERGAERYAKITERITFTPQNIEGIDSQWIKPEGADQQKLILYFHGGGYVSG